MITVNTKQCMFCGKTGTVEVPEDGFQKWRDGVLIQDAMPDVSKEVREVLITGTHPECWKKYMTDGGE